MKTISTIKKKLKGIRQKQNLFLGYSQSSNDYESHIRIQPNRYVY